MANPKIRSFTVLLNGKKAGTINNVKVSYKSGDAPQMGQEGYLGHSDGAFMTSYSATEVVPVKGSSLTELLEKKMLNHEDVDATTFIGGKQHKVVLRIMSMDLSSETASGAATGNIEMEGGKPTLVTL